LTEDPAAVEKGEENTDSKNKEKQHGCRERSGDEDDPGRDQGEKEDVLKPDVLQASRPVFLKADEAMV
jgi:hypothetical protein